MIKESIKKLKENPYKYSKNLSVNELESILNELSEYYYNKKKPLVSDVIYDLLIDVLREKDPNNNLLTSVGKSAKSDVKLPYFMPSLDKNMSDTKFIKRWLKKYTGSYIVSDKLDGVSAMLVKNNNKYELFTRGSGTLGSNISHLVDKIIKNISELKIEDNMAIRGELIISKNNFEKNLSDKYENTRNTVTTLRTSKKPNKKILKYTKFIAYSIVNPRYTQEEQMKLLNKTGLEVVWNKKLDKIDNNIISELLEKRRDESEYDIDGIVVIDSSKIYENTESKPKHAFAFKKILNDQLFESEVLDIEWNISQYGYLKPTVLINPVKIKGVTISKATGHNARFIIDNNIGRGSILQMIRSGDVIPKILKTITVPEDFKMLYPTIPYKWDNNNVEFIVKDLINEQHDVIIIKTIKHFFKTLKIKYLDEGIIKLLVDKNYKNVFDILKMKEKEFSSIPGLGKQLFNKIQNEIETKIHKSKIYQLMNASMCFDRGIGDKKLKLLIDNYPEILKFNKSDFKKNIKQIEERLLNIKGFEKKTIKLILNGIIPFINFSEKLSKIIDLTETYKLKNNNKKQIFKDKIFVFTGFRSDDIKSFIEERGGKVSDSISGKTTNLIFKDGTTSSKIKKAQVLNIKIISKEDFIKKYSI